MKYIVNYSGGLSSHLAAHRIVEEVGRENVVLLFCDTKSEDADLYRFIAEGSRALGIELTTLADGRDIWQVFRDERFLGNWRVDPCSRILKRELADRWVRERFTPENCVRVYGFNACEPSRMERLQSRLLPWKAVAPLLEYPMLKSEQVQPEFEALYPGIAVPRLYGLGAPHNNCGGLCVKAGQKHFAWALKTLPEKYAEWEAEEDKLRAQLGDVSILKDRRGGTSKPLPLKMFRKRLECGGQADLFDNGSACRCFEPESD